MTEPVLQARAVNRGFQEGGTTLQVLRGADLSVAPGERTYLRPSRREVDSRVSTATAPLTIPVPAAELRP